MAKVTYLLLLLCCITALAAQVPTSVRNQSLAGAIDGEWENVYDPIGLSFYNQNYYFTNLSDFTQKVLVYDDSLSMVQKSEFLSEYPFGASFNNPWWDGAKHAFLIRFKDNQYPALGTNTGEITQYSTHYYDTNYDGTYDNRMTTVLTQKNYDDMDERFLVLLNNSLPLGDNNLGFRISYDRSKTSSDQALVYYQAPIGDGMFSNVYAGDIGWAEESCNYRIEDNMLTQSINEEGDFGTTNLNNKISALFSYMKPTSFLAKNSELRYDLSLDYCDANHTETTDAFSGAYLSQMNPNEQYAGNFLTQHKWENNKPSSEVFLKTSLRHNLNKNYPRYKQGFKELSLGVGAMTGSINRKETIQQDYSELYTDAYDQYNTSDVHNYRYELGEDGTSMGIKAQLATKAILNFSQYICFAYGITVDWQSIHSKVDKTIFMHETDMNITGTAFDSEDDHFSTYNYSYKGKYESVDNTLNTILPVALEFSLPKESLSQNDSFSLRNFSFRLGTLFTHKDYFSDRRNEDSGLEVSNTVVVDGTGALISESHNGNNELNSSKEVNKERRGNKIYSAGLGYQHSDFLNIDLGGWVNTNGDEFYLGAMFTLKR